MSKNRGKRPNDDVLFGEAWLSVFKEAVDDLCYLLTKNYAAGAALELVGNRHQLNQHQRMAVQRMSVSDQEIAQRKRSACSASALKGQKVTIDGFNLLILLESAISGAYIFRGRDGLYRDIASVHGTYKRVIQTPEALRLAGNALQGLGVLQVTWLLDAPIAHSGKLKAFLYHVSEENGYYWQIALVNNPDKMLITTQDIVVSSDGWVLNQAARWYNLGGYLIESQITDAHVVVV